MNQPNEIIKASNLAQAYVKVRVKLEYTGMLDVENITAQNPAWKQAGITVYKFNPPNQLDKTVYVQI